MRLEGRLAGGMAYVPGFKCDVFVSFAHLDNVAIGSGSPWINAFVSDLKKVLRMRLGVREEDGLTVYFTGHGSLQAGVDLDASLMENAASAASFIAITSPAYVVADSYTMRELHAFLHAMGQEARIYAIEHSPLDSNDEYPLALRRLKRMPFWQRHPEREMPVTVSAGSDVYLQLLIDLAEQVRRQLKAMRAGTAAPSAEPLPASPQLRSAALGSRGIFLAQVTDDLESEREQVRRYLEQYGLNVLPEATYPQGGEDFALHVERDLARSELFVQLLGRTHAKRPPDLPGGYDRLQFERAVARGLPVLQWSRPDVDTATVTDEAHAQLLGGENVMRVGLESFKAEIVRRDAKPSGKAPAGEERFIFINADRSDIQLADSLRREFAGSKVSAAIPLLQGSSEDVRLDLEENLVDCDALVMVYGEATPVWVRGQLRLYSKLKHRRKQPMKALAICLGPPDAKPDIGMDFADLKQIDCRSGVAAEALRQFLAGIHQ
jgi:hypothetical protein